MNIVHFNQTDVIGGAAIAAYRLHQGLIAEGVSSQLLVANQSLEDDQITTIQRLPRIENRLRYLNEALGLRHLNFISSFKIPQHSFYQQADILNFHNVHGGFFNYLSLPSLTQSKPCVWTLHDMWSFTGGCVYSYDCDRWKIGCGKCPYPDAIVGTDATHWEWKLKDWVYSKSNLTIISPSRWLTQQAKQSILNKFDIHHIPYGINTNAYLPLETDNCRDILGIPRHKKVLMFGSQNLKDPRKGSDLLLKALELLPKSLHSELMLLTVGSGSENILNDLGFPTLSLGYISSDRLKSIVYSAADVFILPTRADNLPLVLQESLACGTPMVSFDVGGVSDLVRPYITGYLAQPENPTDLCTGILQILEDKEQHSKLRQQCREIALAEYNLDLQAKRYIELYKSIM